MLNKIIKIFFSFFFIGSFHLSIAQEIPIGDWRDHLPYSDAISVSYGDNIIYCAANSALFMYDKSDQTIERLTLINGLSDIGLSKIAFNPYNKRVIIAYKNGNLDILDENKNITNLSFIKNSNVIGNKTINNIFIQGKLAYLATGFGIVVIDTDKLEIIDTYLFGPLGNYITTNGVTIDNQYIYAATDQGVYFADKNSVNLADYNAWSLLPDLRTLNYDFIVTYSNRVFVSSEGPTWGSDSLFYNDGGVWQKFLPSGREISSLNISQNHLLISFFNSVDDYGANLTKLKTISSYQSVFFIDPLEAVMDNDGYLLIAERTHGIVRVLDNINSEVIVPNGPSSTGCFNMDLINDELWTVSGGYGIFLQQNLINHKSLYSWSTFEQYIPGTLGGNALDMVSVAINPSNTSNVFVGSWSSGLYEYNNEILTSSINAQNSALDSTFFGTTAIGALAFDQNNNLWATSSYGNNILAVKTPDNTWYNYSFPGKTSPLESYRDIIIDNNNFKWIISPENNKIIIFDDNGTLAEKNDDRSVVNSNLPGSSIKSIAQDLDDEIWIGTDEGIAVFYNPSNVFDENITAEQIYIQQDGQTQILLETETVTSITIDGANRKWIGTLSSGVFLMSEDGTEEIEHFTTENSPLFSNSIYDIVIDSKTGEVYIGTEKGLISYKGTATDADDDFNNIFVYPNPVKPDFTGTIAIRGLVKDTDVRITDISGNIVYQTTSLGGQAIWNGKDFNGNKVQTGVYMIFNGSPEGDKKAAAKILFLN
jgi:hypothetical protein